MSLFKKKSAKEWLDEEDKNLETMIADLQLFQLKVTELLPVLRALKRARKDKLGENVHARMLDILSDIQKLFGLSEQIRKIASKVQVDEKHTDRRYNLVVYYPDGRIAKQISLAEDEIVTIGRDSISGLIEDVSRRHLTIWCKKEQVHWKVIASNLTVVYGGNLDLSISFDIFKKMSQRDNQGISRLNIRGDVYIWDIKPVLVFSYQVT